MKLQNDANMLQIEPEITPYMIEDDQAEVTKWTTANGGKPLISQKLSAKLARLSKDPDADFAQMQAESDRAASFFINEPRMVLKSHTAQMDALATITRRNNHDTGKEARRPK